WVRSWGLVEARIDRIRNWRRLARARVVVSYAEARAGRSGAGALVSPLFWSSRLIAGRSVSGSIPVELPDGRRGWVAAGAIRMNERPTLSLVERIRELLGAPYLWGGRTPAGLDCSAFTQLVLAEQGFRIPRDAAQQFRAATPLREDEAAGEGDVYFFGRPGSPPGHVGLALG